MIKVKAPKVIVTFRTKQGERLKVLARQESRTVSNVVNMAIKEFLRSRGIQI